MATRAQKLAAQQALNANGFPCGNPDGVWGDKSKFAVRKFKRAYAGAVKGLPRLRVRSGRLSLNTRRALDALPHLSPHFTTQELRCKGSGLCYVDRRLLRGLERLRKRQGPFPVISGYRSPEHNANVGGAKYSEHVDGVAADVPGRVSVNVVRSLGIFSGIGYQASTGLVRHVDLRHITPTNMTGGTPANPTTWRYF